MASGSQDEEMPALQGDPEPSTRQDDASWRSIHAPTPNSCERYHLFLSAETDDLFTDKRGQGGVLANAG